MKSIMTGLCVCVAAWGVGLPGTGKAAVLDVPDIDQEQSKWCWAACAEMVLEYFDPGTDYTQCEFAHIEYMLEDVVDCCDLTGSLWWHCDKYGTVPERTFDRHEVTYSEASSPLTWKKVKKEITESRPLLYSWFWSEAEDIGHMVVIKGYGQVSGLFGGKVQAIFYLDPNRHTTIGTENYIKYYRDYKASNHWQTWWKLERD